MCIWGTVISRMERAPGTMVVGCLTSRMRTDCVQMTKEIMEVHRTVIQYVFNYAFYTIRSLKTVFSDKSEQLLRYTG